MTTPFDNIREVGNNDITWTFDGPPYIFLGAKDEHIKVQIDPWPGHANNYFTVGVTLKKLTDIAPCYTPGGKLTVWNSPYETLGRTNGLSERTRVEGRWHPDGQIVDSFDAEIFLSGKRIPIHPAMTRYVVAHEYGHQMQWAIASALTVPYDRLLSDYITLRGDELDEDNQGPNWPKASAEVFACDFRIIVAKIEHEYWPHKDIKDPFGNNEIGDWWHDNLEMMRREVHS